MKKNELIWAIAADCVILGLIAYWFAFAEPERIFLIGHYDAGPLDAITRGRYWMAGLVASGFVMCLSIMLSGVLGIIRRNRPLKTNWNWLHMWIGAIPLLAGGILTIILLAGKSPVPLVDALGCTLLAIAGTGLAAFVFSYQDFRLFLRVALASLGIGPTLLVGQIIQMPSWRSISSLTVIILVLVFLMISPLWALLVRGGCRKLAQCRSPWLLYIGVLTWAYSIVPVAHYLFATPPGYPYITAADNFFARSWWLALLPLLLALLQAIWMNRILNAKPLSFGRTDESQDRSQ